MTSTARTALVTATELPALSSRLSIEGKRTELVRGDLIVHRPAGVAVVPEAGMLDGAPVFSDFSVRVRDLFT